MNRGLLSEEGAGCYPLAADHESTGLTQAGVLPPVASADSSPSVLGCFMVEGQRRARSARGRSRQRTLSSTATGLWAISIVVGLVFSAPKSGRFSPSTVGTIQSLSAFVARASFTCARLSLSINSASVHTGADGVTPT